MSYHQRKFEKRKTRKLYFRFEWATDPHRVDAFLSNSLWNQVMYDDELVICSVIWRENISSPITIPVL